MEKQTLLAIVLSLCILIAWSVLFPPKKPQKPESIPVVQERTDNAVISESPIKNALVSSTKYSSDNLPETLSDIPPKDITIETPNYRAVISTRGAVLKSFLLKKHNHTKPRISLNTFVPIIGEFFGSRIIAKTEDNLLQMVNAGKTGVNPLDINLENDSQLSEIFRNVTYASNYDSIEVTQDSKKLVLTSPKHSGIQIVKTLEFHSDDYSLIYDFKLVNHSDKSRSFQIRHLFGGGRVPDASGATRYGHTGPVYITKENDIETEDADDVENEFQVAESDWFGIEDQYFTTVASSITPIKYGFFKSVPVFTGDNKTFEPYFGALLPGMDLKPDQQIESTFKLYSGPKDSDELAKFGNKLELSHQMTLEILARPLLVLLRWLYGHIGNYGISIIILTIIVRLGMFPLTYKGIVSMRKMQELQPKMAKIKEKYKDNKEKMNVETLGLYKKHKVNPLGGCLPIAVQIPIFFALYSSLSSAVELRHAPFFGWITDLSAPDGLGITPVLMGLSMYLVQKMTPPSAMMDPIQMKVMNMLPVVFTFFTFTFPSGLTIYWVTSNLISVAQQVVLKKDPKKADQGNLVKK